MNRVVLIAMASVCLFGLTTPASADYAVTQHGAWPKSWPKELESLRRSAMTYEGPLMPLLHHAIRFKTREQFEAAWPHILKVKSPGAPIILRRGSNFWVSGAKQGVCVHTPPAGKEPKAGKDIKRSRLDTTNYLELIVDGEIVDLNRIRIPPDTLIIDNRFEPGR